MVNRANSKDVEATPQGGFTKESRRDIILQVQREALSDELRSLDLEGDANDRKPLTAILRIALGETGEFVLDKIVGQYEDENKLTVASVLRMLSKEQGTNLKSPISYVNTTLFSPILVMCAASTDENSTPAKKHPSKDLAKLSKAKCNEEIVPVLEQLDRIYSVIESLHVSKRSKYLFILDDARIFALCTIIRLASVVASIREMAKAPSSSEVKAIDATKSEQQRMFEQRVKDVRYACVKEVQKAYDTGGREGLFYIVPRILDAAADELSVMIKSQNDGLSIAYSKKDMFAIQKAQISEQVKVLDSAAYKIAQNAGKARAARNAASLKRSEYSDEAEAALDDKLEVVVKEAEEAMKNPENAELLSAAEEKLKKFTMGILRQDESGDVA